MLRRTLFISLLVPLLYALSLCIPASVPLASARTLTPQQPNHTQQAQMPHQSARPLSPTNDCNLSGQNGLFPCEVQSSVSPGCLKEHSQPNTSSPQTNCYSAGTILTLTCQIAGGVATAPGGAQSSVWDKETNGNFVSDLFMATSATNGGFSPPIPNCGVCRSCQSFILPPTSPSIGDSAMVAMNPRCCTP
jgi:hypothetical protein